MRIITNPLTLNYVEPDDSLATSFTNPHHIKLPPTSVDSTTFSRGSGGRMSNVVIEDEVQAW